jgi:plasmid stabilization system protein ParE
MSRHVELHAEAESDMAQALDWYDAQQPGLGRRFVNAVNECFEQIAAVPLAHGVVEEDVRTASVAVFPYKVYYRVVGNEIAVVAVLHASRNPDVWLKRTMRDE